MAPEIGDGLVEGGALRVCMNNLHQLPGFAAPLKTCPAQITSVNVLPIVGFLELPDANQQIPNPVIVGLFDIVVVEGIVMIAEYTSLLTGEDVSKLYVATAN